MNFIRRHRFLQGALLIGPAGVWAALFIVVPTVTVALMSFWKIKSYHLVHDWNLSSYADFINTPIYHDPLFFTLENAAMVAFVCVLLSLIVAHFIHFRVKRHKMFFFGTIVIALWMGYLLRIFGWRIVLGREGVINSVLMDIGVIDHPFSFLVFSRFAVVLTQVHLAMPFAFIPIYAAMERLSPATMQAAGDLYANRTRSLLHVQLPLISAGVITGGTFAFVLAFGDYFAPNLVGAPSNVTIGNIAADQFGAAFNWPLGAAIGVVMTITVLLAMALPEIFGLVRRLVPRRQEAVT
jgi:spermidine/putrescine transport system permease protein